MNPWKRRVSLPHFSIIRGALDAALIARIVAVINQSPRQVTGEQSGFTLEHVPVLQLWLQPLTAGVRRWAGRRLYLHLDKSSHRTQEPSNKAALPLHQDVAALMADAAASCVVWLPLCRIDPETPGLQICLWQPDVPLVHVSNAVGYSVLFQTGHLPMVPIQHLEEGDAVIFTGYTIHGTHIPLGASKTRRSLDLRFLPEKPK